MREIERPSEIPATHADTDARAMDADASPSADARMRTGAIRILLVDDHVVMRAGTRRILEDEADLLVVGEANDGATALELAMQHVPDVVLLDIRMPGIDGVRVCREIRQRLSTTRVLILSGYDSGAMIRSLRRTGASGYVLKSAGPEELIASIRAVAAGDEAFGPSVAHALDNGEANASSGALTSKEREILHMVANGLKNRELAETLSLSVNTVEFHLRNIYVKLSASSRADALVRAQQLGWLDTREPLC